MTDRIVSLLRRPLALADAGMNRLYTWRYNPLYQSGTIVVLAFIAMLLTGLYLLLFYRISSPYESVLRLENQAFAGQWIRAMHRYAADLTVVAALVHAFRMFVQGRSWGARTLAWVSGFILLFLMFVCGWTGYVMIWDQHAHLLATEGARLLDILPIFSEPLARTFVGERPIPGAFFFLNLFAHVALPIGVAVLLWVHVSKVARPVLLPPRGLAWSIVGLLFVASVLAPAPLGPRADLFALPETIDIDWLYSFWLPASRQMTPAAAWSAFIAMSTVLILTPLWTRPRKDEIPPASETHPLLCTGCFQCSEDCPYEAIDMITIPERDHPVAKVDPALCVSCGICTGSCAPMAVGPPTRAGRDEVAHVRALAAEHDFQPSDVVVVACERGAGRVAFEDEIEGVPVYPTICAGNVHTSVIELLLRSGAGGVLVASCPPRDCCGREGPKWLEERIHRGREAELRETLDRRRLRIVYAGEGERGLVMRELAQLRVEIKALADADKEESVEIETVCEPKPMEEVS